LRIERDELACSREPHQLPIERNPVDSTIIDGLQLANDLRFASLHDSSSELVPRPDPSAPRRERGVTFVAQELAAARALALGAPLQALSLVGRVESGLGLTLRGIAYAQLGDLVLAKQALERALHVAVGKTLLHARAALVEVTLETGDPAAAVVAAQALAHELTALGDTRNAGLMQLVQARGEVLRGRLGEARRLVEEVREPELSALAHLAHAELAIRTLSATDAREAIARARACSPHPLLGRALDSLADELARPIARLLRRGVLAPADLATIEATRDELLVDDCRRLVRGGLVTIPLSRRPVLFALLVELARAYPASVPRDVLAARAFDARKVNASHRARLRVEIGRLRKVMEDLAAEPVATADGYTLRSKRDVVVLLPPTDESHARIALLLGDGAAWTARGLAEHAGVSMRTAQRALAALVASGGAVRRGNRYNRPGTPVASRMLLLGLVPSP
jgi:hypothetical protein